MGINDEFREKIALLDFCDVIYCTSPKSGAKYAFDGKRLRDIKIRQNTTKYILDGALYSNKKLQVLVAKIASNITASNSMLSCHLEGSWPDGFRFDNIHNGGEQLEQKILNLIAEAEYNSFCEYYCIHCTEKTMGHFMLFSTLSKTELRQRASKPGVSTLLDLTHFYFSHTRPNRTNPHVLNGTFKEKTIRVIELTAQGYSSKEISEMLHLTVRGVNYHIERAKEQLQAANKAELVSMAKEICLF